MDLQFAITHLYIIKTVGKYRPETCMPLDPDRVARCACISELLTNSTADLIKHEFNLLEDMAAGSPRHSKNGLMLLGLRVGLDVARGPEDTYVYLVMGHAWSTGL